MLASKKQSGVVDVFVSACVQSRAWTDMLQFFPSLEKSLFIRKRLLDAF